jgi:iron complex outermembrane receptor protein
VPNGVFHETAAPNVVKALLHLDAENLFDRDYIESSFSDVWITPGAPRTIRARLALAL